MQAPLEIAGNKVKPGQRVTIDLPMAQLYTHTDMTLTAHVIHGRKPGPRLFICSTVHGDEINGVEIIRRLLKRRNLSSLHGTLIAIPVVNSFGFIHRSRYLPDRRDLNRSFPGSLNGSLASRLAALLLNEILELCSHGIDLHTGSNHRFNLPQIRASLDDAETEKLARAFGAPVMIHSRLRDGSLRDAVADQGIPVLLYEAGEAYRFDELSIRTGVRGIVAVMRMLGMLPKRSTKVSHPVFQANTSKWVRAPISGILSEGVNVGRQVAKGDKLGIVCDPYGEKEEVVRAPFAGLVIGRLQLPLVYQGDALFHLAIFDEGQEVEPILQGLVSDLGQEDFWPQVK
ncbi:MAG TPA: succinylglutamate desuccinylase/aspartoacylase family protein [Desulfuromonadales bacterium]|nr:succinylglutamate desuccinylase/aspartoacylase family protein [Desulfuromonadales bacterium]